MAHEPIAVEREHGSAPRDGVNKKNPAGSLRVKEARTYEREAPHSFFIDAYRSQHLGDMLASGRLSRHASEVTVEREYRDRGDTQSRAVSTAGFAGLVIPQYLVDHAALVLRNGRPIANTMMQLPIPEQGMLFQIPRGTTGATEAIQAAENASASSTDEVWANVSVPVATIAGQQDVSRQSLERGIPGLDQLVYLDLAGAYMATLDTQVINGSGAAGQMLGILNTASIYAATLFGAAPTAANFTLKVAGAVAGVAGAGTAINPTVIGMHPRRWGWLQGLTDTAGRPLAVANAVGPYNAGALITEAGGYGQEVGFGIMQAPRFVGVLANGLPVITDANIPTNIGTNLEDVVLCYDNRQGLLFEEGDGMPRQLRFEQTLGNQLTVKLVAYGYAAFTAGRYPQAFAKLGGLDSTATFGLVAPTF